MTTEKRRTVLTPERASRADGARAKLAELYLSETDVTHAVAWVRSSDGKARSVIAKGAGG